MKRYIGVDLHKTVFTACYLDEDERREIRHFKLSKLKDFKETLTSEDQIAIESVVNSRYFREQVAPLVEKVVTVAPSNFVVICQSSNKTDSNDAVNLAEFLKIGKLPTARVMTNEQARIKSLTGTRDKLVKQRTALINKTHSILNSLGIHTKKGELSSDKGLRAVKSLNLERLAQFEIELLADQITNLNQAIDRIEKEIEMFDNHLPGHECLKSIKGIGSLSASILLSVIGDVNDFPNKDHLASYFGVVPRVKQSAGKTRPGHITKKGSKIGRTILIQCTYVVIKYNPILRSFYQRLKEKKGNGVAIVATGRKFLEFIYNTLSHNIIWENSNIGIVKSIG